MTIPEFTIFNLLEMFLNVTREEYWEAVSPSDSFLYKIFNEDENTGEKLTLEEYNLFEQAKDVIIAKGNQKALKIKIGYTLDKLPPVAVSILMPSDSPSPAEIGDSEGYLDSIVETHVDGDYNRGYKTSTNNSSYNLLITSTNMNEVVLIYHWLKAMFLVFREQLELSGLKNCSFGGADVNFDAELIPTAIHHRNFNINFVYEYSVPKFFADKILGIKTKGDMNKIL